MIDIQGQVVVLPDEAVGMMLGQMIAERGGDGPPTAADSAALREQLDSIVAAQMAAMGMGGDPGDGPAPGPTQCHDITVYPAIGLAGGACEGYGMLLDISDPTVNPRRIAEVADSNFSYWHSATFNNDGTAILFTDEWGGGGGPKCRADDPVEWGANAIFTVEDGELVFRSYYKMPAVQTTLENCVAHNGSLIPVPGRDIMIQGWYQGGISLIDWTDPANAVEIGYHDRGPFNPDRMQMAGSWSVYWYNGLIVNSEIARGLDIFELTPSESLTQNEIDAANSVRLNQLNSQGQPVYEWPATFALARAYIDQLERWHGMSAPRVAAARSALDSAESATGSARNDALGSLAAALAEHAAEAADSDKVARARRRHTAPGRCRIGGFQSSTAAPSSPPPSGPPSSTAAPGRPRSPNRRHRRPPGSPPPRHPIPPPPRPPAPTRPPWPGSRPCTAPARTARSPGTTPPTSTS